MGKGKGRETLAETLLRTFLDSGQTVATASRGAGIAQPVLHRFVHGQRDLTLRTADKLAAYFGLDLRPRARRPRPQR
jgi:plasmid maintenance system antidote protein VapI